MSQKITLSIPDRLYEKLEGWRASFNLSKLFQEALAEAIQKKEEFQKRLSEDFDIKEVIHRLRSEKQAWGREHFALGRREGIRWARIAHYTDLIYVLQYNDTYQLLSDSKLSEYFDRLCDYFSGPEEARKFFMDGWFKGVSEFWSNIKEKL